MMNTRIALTSACLGLALAASACATAQHGRASNYSEELAQLTTDCAERGGILSQTGDNTTGRPQTDYVCKINGATRIQ